MNDYRDELERMTALYNIADRECAKHRGDAADLRAALQSIEQSAAYIDVGPSDDEDDARNASAMLDDGGIAEDTVAEILDKARAALAEVAK